MAAELVVNIESLGVDTREPVHAGHQVGSRRSAMRDNSAGVGRESGMGSVRKLGGHGMEKFVRSPRYDHSHTSLFAKSILPTRVQIISALFGNASLHQLSSKLAIHLIHRPPASTPSVSTAPPL